MENQIQSLKLNVKNINSYLINSNKQLRSLKIQKKNLFFKIEKQKEVSAEENRIENKNLGVGSTFSKFASVISAPAKNIFDKILEFVGLIALGILVQNIPTIIKKIDDVLNSDVLKGIGNVLNVIGIGFSKLGELIDILTPQERNNLDKELQKIDRDIEDDFKNASQAEKDTSVLDEELKKRERNKSQYNPSGGRQQYNQSRSSAPPSIPSTTPRTNAPLPPSNPDNSSQKLSKGGTVQNPNQQNKGYQPRKSGQLKQAERGMGDGFTNFSKSVDNIKQSAQQDEKNVLAFAKMSDNFREYIGITTATRRGGPPGPGQNQSGQQALRNAGSQYSGQSFSSGASIGPTGDTDGNQTGLDMNLSGGIGTPIYAPFDLIYRDKGTDGMPSVGLDGTPDVLGPAGRGFGYYGAYYFKRGNKEYEVLMGHFKSLPYRGSKDGEVIPQGTLLGYQGASGRTKSDTNGVYPHISLHVNGLGFQASNSLLVQVANQILNAKPSTTTLPKNQQGPVANLGNSGAGNGGRRLNSINNGNQSVVIYAVQPIETFVPFPYPVLSQSSSSSSRSKPKLPAIWRN